MEGGRLSSNQGCASLCSPAGNEYSIAGEKHFFIPLDSVEHGNPVAFERFFSMLPTHPDISYSISLSANSSISSSSFYSVLAESGCRIMNHFCGVQQSISQMAWAVCLHGTRKKRTKTVLITRRMIVSP